jgi:hypothetical protein
MATLGSAALLVLARAFRRGLDVRRALTLGVLTGLGTVTKLNFLALLPGIALGLVLLAARAPLARRAVAARTALMAAAAAATPLVVYLVLTQTVWNRALLGHGAAGTATLTGVSGATSTPSGGVHGLLDFMWQMFLPPLSFMNHIWFHNLYPPWDIYFKEFIGVFGWIDYSFPNWVYTFAGGIFALLLALVLTTLVRSHRALRARGAEAITYLAVVAGLLLAIARAGFPFQLQTGYVFAQARYLVPLTPLYGLFIALAIRGAGRRLGPALACVVVVLALAHTLFAQLLTLGRFYG